MLIRMCFSVTLPLTVSSWKSCAVFSVLGMVRCAGMFFLAMFSWSCSCSIVINSGAIFPCCRLITTSTSASCILWYEFIVSMVCSAIVVKACRCSWVCLNLPISSLKSVNCWSISSSSFLMTFAVASRIDVWFCNRACRWSSLPQIALISFSRASVALQYPVFAVHAMSFSFCIYDVIYLYSSQ